MFDQIFYSVGEIKEVFTLVDYYQYIKGVEYLICLAFFAGFPMFYRYLHGNETKRPQTGDAGKRTGAKTAPARND